MAACAMVVIVAFGSACTKNYQIKADAFQTLQKNGAPKFVKTVDGDKLKNPVKSELSIVHKDEDLPVPHSFEMSDSEIKFQWRRWRTDVESIRSIPLSEVEAYQVRQVSGGLTAVAIIGTILGVGAVFFGVLYAQFHEPNYEP